MNETSHGIYAVFSDACACVQRPWWRKQFLNHTLHPVVDKLIRNHRPTNWQQLLLEWPHVATTDTTRLAYTQSETKGINDIQTVTTPGKYVARHFPELPSHTVRDVVAVYGASGCEILTDIEAIVNAVKLGPNSCMKGHDNKYHPYRCYDPELGWSLAIQRHPNGQINARALLNTDSDGAAYFVRTFETGYRSDEIRASTTLNAWLKSKGYQHRNEWEEGTQLARIRTNKGGSGVLCPYLDGDNQHIDVYGNYLAIVNSGEYEATNTDGTAGDSSNDWECENCGDTFDEDDDYTHVGYNQDCQVCDRCARNSYVYGWGRNRERYHFHEDNAVTVGDDSYHETYLDLYNIVELIDDRLGDGYAFQDDAVKLDSEWYHLDDPRIVRLTNEDWSLKVDAIEINGDWYHPNDCVSDGDNKWLPYDTVVLCVDGNYWHQNFVVYIDNDPYYVNDTWVCAGTSDYVPNAIEPRIVNGKTYHPDFVLETEPA